MLTTKEAAFRLGWCIDTVQRWIKRGWLPAKKLPNGRYLIKEDDIEAVRG